MSLTFSLDSSIVNCSPQRPTSSLRWAGKGGTVLREFDFAAARIWIQSERVPILAEMNPGSSVDVVLNLRRYDWSVAVGFKADHPLGKADSLEFVARGGAVRHLLPLINGLSGILPNRSIRSFRADPYVDHVSASGEVCPL